MATQNIGYGNKIKIYRPSLILFVKFIQEFKPAVKY